MATITGKPPAVFVRPASGCGSRICWCSIFPDKPNVRMHCHKSFEARRLGVNVPFWHKADITAVLIHVRFWG
jgi:hypothetical protein